MPQWKRHDIGDENEDEHVHWVHKQLTNIINFNLLQFFYELVNLSHSVYLSLASILFIKCEFTFT